jgi:sugar lactone lactonase YvrE
MHDHGAWREPRPFSFSGISRYLGKRLPMSPLITVLIAATVLGADSPGEPAPWLPRLLPEAEGVMVPERWIARVLCTGIPGADGLAVSPDGELYIASETTGRVLRVGGPDSLDAAVEGLDHPEGIAFGRDGCLLVVEDAASGRLLSIDPSCGSVRVLAEGLVNPEGVTISAEGVPLVTQSSAEGSPFPPLLTSLSSVGGDSLTVIASALYLWSFTGVAVDSSGAVFVCNETAGMPFISESVIRIDPSDGSLRVFCSGLRSCEGLCFSPGGRFPLYVAEEDTGDGSGRVSVVDRQGRTSVFASGFGNIEDVLVDSSGRIFVSDDTGGKIILIEPVTE